MFSIYKTTYSVFRINQACDIILYTYIFDVPDQSEYDKACFDWEFPTLSKLILTSRNIAVFFDLYESFKLLDDLNAQRQTVHVIHVCGEKWEASWTISLALTIQRPAHNQQQATNKLSVSSSQWRVQLILQLKDFICKFSTYAKYDLQ